MPVDQADPQQEEQHSGWRKEGDDDDNGARTKAEKKHKKKHHKAKSAVAPLLPSQGFKSIRTVAVAGVPVTAAAATGATEGEECGSPDNSARAGATRRKQNGLSQTAVTKRLSKQMVKETKKKAIAREKAEEIAREQALKDQTNAPKHDDDESDDALDPTVDNGWLEPETRIARKKAKQMRGLRTNSVEYLEHDDLNHLSAERPFIKSGGIRCPHPFGRKLMEERQELVGILNLPRNKKMRKAGIKESHLAKIVDVYRGVMFNALARIEEDEAGPVGSLGKAAEDKGVRVSYFTTTLGISPFLFVREVLWASNRLYAHAIPGEMNRATWVFGCISLCLMSEKELVEFIFHSCKRTEAGELEAGELDRLAKSLHLSNDVFWPAFSQQLEDIIKAHENGDLIMTLDFFLDMHHKYPMILYPALRVQELVQRRTLGLYAWGRLNNRLDRYLLKQKRLAKAKPCCLWVLLGLKR